MKQSENTVFNPKDTKIFAIDNIQK